MDLAPLAQRTAELSRSLATLGQECEHSAIHSDIADIANESLRLSSTLWRLREAIDVNRDKYTAVFSQDLAEISSEMHLLCDEIAECCAEMQKMDTPGPVPWFFKKGRVSKLQKHLVALKTTLVVMRTVLHHSKDYGLQTSPYYLAESSPHIVQEDRVILDSIFAKNRHAIQELYDLEKDPHSHRSDANVVSGGTAPLDQLQRRFSKRGTHIGVHMSILGMAPLDTTAGLRARWLQAAKSGHASDSNSSPTMQSPQTMQMPHKTAKLTMSVHDDDDSCQEPNDDQSSTAGSCSLTNGGGSHADEGGGGGAEEEKAEAGCCGNDQDDCTAKDGAYDEHARRTRPGTAAARRSGHSLKRLGNPAAHAVRRLIKRLSFRGGSMSSAKQAAYQHDKIIDQQA